MRGIEPDLRVLEQPNLRPQDRIALREEDLFPTALPPEPVERVPPRPRELAGLTECVANQGTADKRWAEDKPGDGSSDYPLYVAQDSLACVNGHQTL